MRISDWSSDVCSSALAITILIDYARECGSEADGDHRVFIDRTLQDGLDLDLTDTERRFAGVMAIVFSADDLALLVRRGVMETVKFMPDERRDPRDVECILARDAGIAQLLGKAKTLEQLHAARVGQIHLGTAGSGRVALHQQRADTIARQIEREGHADQPPPSDQHWGFDHVRHSESISLGFLFPDSSGQSEGSDACIMTAPASDLTDRKSTRLHSSH